LAKNPDFTQILRRGKMSEVEVVSHHARSHPRQHLLIIVGLAPGNHGFVILQTRNKRLAVRHLARRLQGIVNCHQQTILKFRIVG
jgi:allophanate hydrolase subunit 1